MARLAGSKLDGLHGKCKEPESCPLGMLTGDLYGIQKGSRARPPGEDGRLNPAICFHSVLRLLRIPTKGIFLIRHIRMRTLKEETTTVTYLKQKTSERVTNDLGARGTESKSVVGSSESQCNFCSRIPQRLGSWQRQVPSAPWCEEDVEMGSSG